MKRSVTRIAVVSAVLLVIIIGAAMAFMLMRKEPEWTSDSLLAVREFNAGLEAERKFYQREAREHFERALKLDPDFVMAQIKVAERQIQDIEEAKKLVEKIDQDKLNDRERFIVRSILAKLNRLPNVADDILEAYLEEHPNDPIGVSRLCVREWDRHNWDAAAKCYRRLIELDPNWVSAQNNLGYIAMAQGRFKEAEELFRTYRYIAPDQANPHDSLGELLTLVGRYEEAEQELNEALKIRSDFCASYDHLVTIAILEGDFEKGPEIMQRSNAANCGEELFVGATCALDTFRAYTRKRWSETVDAALSKDCYKKSPAVLIVAFAAALASGRVEDAALMEKSYRERDRKAYKAYEETGKDPMLLHMEGIRLAFEGKDTEAAQKLREADKELVYWGDAQGIMKLYNRVALAEVLRNAGKDEEVRQLMAEVKAVNPDVFRKMRVPHLE